MKGQYLAIESIATFGMGLLVAIGTVTAFTGYKDDVVAQAGERQVEIVESRLTEAVYSLRSVESGHRTVELPERVGGQDYEIAFTDGIHVFANNKEYVSPMNQLSSYEFQGSAEGGSVKVFKNGNQFTVRTD